MVLFMKKMFQGFTNVSEILHRKEYFILAHGDNLIAKMSLSWKKSFSQGVVIPHKIKNCNKCTKDLLCEHCDILINQDKVFSAKLNELNREPPIEFGNMLPKYLIT